MIEYFEDKKENAIVAGDAINNNMTNTQIQREEQLNEIDEALDMIEDFDCCSENEEHQIIVKQEEPKVIP